MHTLEQLRSGELKGIKRLTLSENLKEFPLEILSLSESLEILDLSSNHLSAIPKEIAQLKKLKIAFFSNNLFTHVPHEFKANKSLYMLGFKANKIEAFDEDILPLSISWLILTDNKIKKIPNSIGDLHLLQKCALAGNQIEEIPQSISKCKNLELIRLSANNLSALPLELLELPRLSWLAFSGNPFTPTPAHSLQEMDINELEILELLGQGASGHISKAKHIHTQDEYAIKIFKGAITSDGYAKDEMSASMGAGEHPNLIKVLAKISSQNELGLLLELIPNIYKNLGNPPNFETCTRDTFEKESRFSIESISTIAKAISSAAKHLHNNNIMHGDLYAHNILINDADHTYLGDFGAASFYTEHHELFEKIEIRAFGCLLDDLLSLCQEKQSSEYQKLYQIAQNCLNTEHKKRPLFSEIKL